MKRTLLFLCLCSVLLLSCSDSASDDGTPDDSDSTRIIADHAVVDRYDDIPQKYIDIVKTWLVDIAGESHSSGYRIGMDLLAQRDAKFAVETFDSSIPAATPANLRLGRHGSVGEADFYTSAAAVTAMKAKITELSPASNPLRVLAFGWCWDMTWHNDPAGTIDPENDVRWAGSSEGGPEGDLGWGLDAVESYNAYCAAEGLDCQVVFTTGPVDGNEGSENGFQRELKHDYIRTFVKADSARILFDYADILCWSDAGEQNLTTWNDGGTERIHANIHPDNMLDYDGSWNKIPITEDGDHIGEVGTLRLAKAMWWMLARLAGWDGVSAD